MESSPLNYQKIKRKYLQFLSSQEVMSEPFRNKLSQLKKFYLPISKMIKEEYFKKKTNKNNRLSWRTRNWKINYFKYTKNYFKRGLRIRNSNIFNR